MAVTKDQIRHIAVLARLYVDDEETEALGRHLNGILEHFERLRGLGLDDIDPFSRDDLDVTPWREDKPRSWAGREEALDEAPRREGDFFRVPRILEDENE
jgi:aspartyl/glutamyl-tRNA(Asn/Gln) amidotransferase C subunit